MKESFGALSLIKAIVMSINLIPFMKILLYNLPSLLHPVMAERRDIKT
jgi:hypothetical protein